MGSDGSNPRRLTDHSADDRSPSWSPDGQYIAFESERDDRVGIYVMGSDGSNPHRLTDHLADYRAPSWSPDGRYIAFESNRDGDWGIYVMDLASYTGGEPTAMAETSWGRIKRHLQDRTGN
jgi:Tol biopolymer transport system component